MTTLAPTPVQQPQRSWFWPLILIAVGVIWLLRNVGIVSATNMAVLLRLWPLLFIAIGLNIILAKRIPQAGLWIGIVTVGIAIALMVVAPTFGFGKIDTKSERFTEPVGSATSATVALGFGAGRTVVQALGDSDQLITADVTHVGNVKFSASGTATKIVRLTQDSVTTNTSMFDWGMSLEQLYWNVGLTPKLPITLQINSGVGDTTVDLSGVKVKSLEYNNGVGETLLILPGLESSYRVMFNSGVGKTRIEIRPGANVDLQVNGGVGSFDIVLPPDASVRLDATSDMGSVQVPGTFVRVSGTNDHDGVWTSTNYDSTLPHINITYKGGLGSLTVR